MKRNFERKNDTTPFIYMQLNLVKIFILFIAVVFLLTITVFLFAKKKKVKDRAGVGNAKQESKTASDKPSATPIPFWSKSEVGKSLAKRLNKDQDSLVFDITSSIRKDDKYFLKGAVGEKGVVGGLVFYVIVDKSVGRDESDSIQATDSADEKTSVGAKEVQLIYIGEDQPECSKLEEYNPPINWLADCE